MNSASPDSSYLPTASPEMLTLRAELLHVLREFFRRQDYVEVETPILSADIVVDAHLEPFLTTLSSGQEYFLQTSPEFAMKRLLAGGMRAIVQFTRAFRVGEQGRRHNPEFSIVEWYRVGDAHREQMDFVEQLVGTIRDEVQRRPLPGGCRPNASLCQQLPFERLTYDEAFERYAGQKVLSADIDDLRRLALGRNLHPPESLSHEDRDDWLNWLLAELVEPHLGQSRPTFLYDYPASQAALAVIRTSSDGPPVAERFELYIGGIELCNGYHELTDADELRDRMRVQAAIRTAQYSRPLPETNRLLDAMEAGLPASSGVALGWDRLLMLAVGADSIEDVIAFPFDRA